MIVNQISAGAGSLRHDPPKRAGTLNWEKWGILYARIALGAAFLSGIASRFGLYGKNVGYGNFASFIRYTAAVNCLTKQEVNVLILILGLLITGWAVRSYRAAHPPVVAAQQFKP